MSAANVLHFRSALKLIVIISLPWQYSKFDICWLISANRCRIVTKSMYLSYFLRDQTFNPDWNCQQLDHLKKAFAQQWLAWFSRFTKIHLIGRTSLQVVLCMANDLAGGELTSREASYNCLSQFFPIETKVPLRET